MRPDNDSHAHGGGKALPRCAQAAHPTPQILSVQEEAVLRMRQGAAVADDFVLEHKACTNAPLLRQLHAMEVQLRQQARARRLGKTRPGA